MVCKTQLQKSETVNATNRARSRFDHRLITWCDCIALKGFGLSSLNTAHQNVSSREQGSSLAQRLRAMITATAYGPWKLQPRFELCQEVIKPYNLHNIEHENRQAVTP